MRKKLIVEAFKKAEEEITETGLTPSVYSCAKHLSLIVSREEDFPYGEKSLRNLYNLALKETEKDIEIKQIRVIDALCKYLGYINYEDFTKEDRIKKKDDDGIVIILPNGDNSGKINKDENSGDIVNEKGFRYQLKIFNTKNKLILSISTISVIILFMFFLGNKQRWMVWQKDHFVEVKFDTEKYNIDQLKFYKKERVLNFKQIIPDCNTPFFNKNGSENLWYGKNHQKELEFFTSHGLHPETGSTLKKITLHMIKTHICETYK